MRSSYDYKEGAEKEELKIDQKDFDHNNARKIHQGKIGIDQNLNEMLKLETSMIPVTFTDSVYV